jgi:D-arabinonate dehydratase
MRITQVRCTRVAMPLEKPLGVGSWWTFVREFVLVWVETGAGVVGHGFTYGGASPNAGRVAEVAIQDLIAPILIGEDPRDVERLWWKMYGAFNVLGRKGLYVWALSALDIALWDIKAKLAGEPLHRYLGGARSEVMAYATGGYYRPNEGLVELAREMERYREAGFLAVKLKLGQLPPQKDAERVRVCRDALGPDIKLAVDANHAWSTPHQAIQAIRLMEPYDLWFVEEPVGPDNFSGAAAIARAVDVPIMNGEPSVTHWDLREVLNQGACDILQIDATVVGGVTEWMKGAHLAECFDVPVKPVWFADLHIQLAAAVRHAIAVEYHLPSEQTLRFADLLAHPLEFTRGMLTAPDRSGNGIVFDEKAVAKHAV